MCEGKEKYEHCYKQIYTDSFITFFLLNSYIGKLKKHSKINFQIKNAQYLLSCKQNEDILN